MQWRWILEAFESQPEEQLRLQRNLLTKVLRALNLAKWSRDWPGQSGHLHLSLQDRKGKGVFHDPKAPHKMSATMRI